MGQYTTKGLYNSYDKKNKERDKLDYYATKPGETLNILNQLNIDFTDTVILEPCCGGGHMARDIYTYCDQKACAPSAILCTDVHEHEQIFDYPHQTGEVFDFLADGYEQAVPNLDKVDWIIMNPPFATIEPFSIRALEIANKGIIMFARLQFLEASGRYEKIFKENPPSDIYVYVDRIQCWKGGKEPEGSSAQAYAWFIWDKEKNNKEPNLHWLRRVD